MLVRLATTTTAAVAIGLIAASTTPATLTNAKIQPVLQGYDVVAYFSLDPSDPGVQGSSKYAANLTTSDLSGSDDAADYEDMTFTFYFENAKNQALFEADPWKYAPQWGGF